MSAPVASSSNLNPQDTRRGQNVEKKRRIHEEKKFKVIRKIHLKTIKKETTDQRKEKGKLLRDKFQQIKHDEMISRANGLDPLQMFPEEIWAMILAYITDSKDLLHCYRTCELFKKIVNPTKTQWMLHKVFPILCSELEKKEVLSCRQVCRNWSSGIESYIAYSSHKSDQKNCHLLEPFTGLVRHSKQFCTGGNFIVPFFENEAIPGHHNNVRDLMKQHQRNPFIDNGVNLVLESLATDPKECDFSTYSDVKQVITDFGQHIKRLQITGNCRGYSIFPSHLYNITVNALKHCEKLDTLTVWDVTVKWDFPNLSQYSVIDKNALPDHFNLKHLRLWGGMWGDKAANILPIQDTLLTKYSNQLINLWVFSWNADLYHQLNWESLQVLYTNDTQFNSLEKLNAPNVQRVMFRLVNHNYKFSRLIRVINKFPKLNSLQLFFAFTFPGFERNKLYKRKSQPLYVCSPSVTYLSIQSVRNHTACFDILTYFPHLKRLCLTCQENDVSNTIIPAPKFNIVDLAKYIWQDSGKFRVEQEIYKSNVWKVCSKLEFLKVVLQSCENTEKKTRVYTRQGYDQTILLETVADN